MTDIALKFDSRQYDWSRAEWIAEQYSNGESLLNLHDSFGDRVPAPLIVNRWRRDYPAFDLLMVEAELTRAEVFADKTIHISMDENRTAAHARNAVKAHQWMAERMNRNRYGNTRQVMHSGSIDHDHTIKRIETYSDEQLQAIIRGDDLAAIDGDSKRIEAPPPPQAENRPGLEAKDGLDLSSVISISNKTFVGGDEKNFPVEFLEEGPDDPFE